MTKQKTQQFAKFYIKDLKTRNTDYRNEKFVLDELSNSSTFS